MSGEEVPLTELVDEGEMTPTVGEMHQKVADFLKEVGVEMEPEDLDFCFIDPETGQQRDFGDAEGNVVGFLYNHGLDGHEVLAELEILEEEDE